MTRKKPEGKSHRRGRPAKAGPAEITITKRVYVGQYTLTNPKEKVVQLAAERGWTLAQLAERCSEKAAMSSNPTRAVVWDSSRLTRVLENPRGMDWDDFETLDMALDGELDDLLEELEEEETRE